MSRRLVIAVSAICALVAVVAGVLVGRLTSQAGPAGRVPPVSGTATGTAPPSSPTPGLPDVRSVDAAGRAFLSRYVGPDGRVVRRDQGGDTVSEGQAYAMLVAVALGDRAGFASVWNWTDTALRRPDGLLSWRWADGQVVDAASASDADLDAARALILAGKRFDDQRYTSAGTDLGRAILQHETVATGAGQILTAGSWAMAEPYAYNPSYPSPAAFALLGDASGDPRWAQLAVGSRRITAELLSKAPLPPDWAQVHGDGAVDAMPGPQGHGQSVRFGYDAARTTIWLAESCDAADRALAARQVAPLDRAGDNAELDLGGAPVAEGASVVESMAHAAALAAAGDGGRALSELAHADRLAQAEPSYYGAAWAALGALTLSGTRLGGCPPVPAAP